LGPSQFSEIVDMETLIDDAMAMALALSHPIYDCVYLALSAQRSVPLVTADARLAVLGERTGVETRLLASA
jgi:predicted nucleic acid-binding protein